MNRDFGFHPVRLPVHERNRKVKRLRCVYSLLLLGFWLVGCDDDPLTDLTILGTEVVQGASVSANAASPAAQRDTTVRVRLETDSSYNVTGVAGSLSVWVDGAVVATDLAAVNAPVTVFSARNLTPEGEDASLYFELDASAGVQAGSNVDFFVSVTAPGQFVQGKASIPGPAIVADGRLAPSARRADRGFLPGRQPVNASNDMKKTTSKE